MPPACWFLRLAFESLRGGMRSLQCAGSEEKMGKLHIISPFLEAKLGRVFLWQWGRAGPGAGSFGGGGGGASWSSGRSALLGPSYEGPPTRALLLRPYCGPAAALLRPSYYGPPTTALLRPSYYGPTTGLLLRASYGPPTALLRPYYGPTPARPVCVCACV